MRAVDQIELAFVGDVCLASVMRHLPKEGFSFPGWAAIETQVGKVDRFVGNLECCLVDERCPPEAAKQRMAVPATASSILRDMGFTDMSFANNHALDCGARAIGVGRERLGSHGIHTFGAGANLASAEEAVFTQCQGHTLALLGACDQLEYRARSDRAGVAPLIPGRLLQRVRSARRRADVVVVVLHADLEFSVVPGRWRQRLSRALVDVGASLVIQHHPHVLQGIERYRSGLIAYSLGNFVFGVRGNAYQERHPGVFDSMVLVVDVAFEDGAPTLDWRAVPVRIGDDHLPYLLAGREADDVQRRVRELSALLTDETSYRREWLRRCRLEAKYQWGNTYYALRRGHVHSALRRQRHLLGSVEHRRWALGLLSAGWL